jgi:SAM-dependent methyltransferase
MWKVAQEGEQKYWHSRCADAIGIFYEMGEHLDLAWRLTSIIRKPNTILDVGVGPMGIGLLWLYPMSSLKIGLDPLPRLVPATGNPYADSVVSAIQKDTAYIQAKGEQLPFKNDFFDLVICNNVFDHSVSHQELLAEMVRVTKKNGYWGIGVDTNPILGFIIRGIDRNIRRHLNTYKLHPQDIIIGTLDKFLNDHGFLILSTNKASAMGRICGRRRMQWWVAQKL